MSKKNLSRTVIEGGRYNGNKWDRRQSHAEVRAELRNYLTEVTHDPDNYDEYDIEPLRPVYKGFTDKLSPMYRWLNSKVGRPWDDVYSEITKSFDTRTTAGRHIVHDHLMSSVQIGPETHRYYYKPLPDPTTSHSDNDFYVDDNGILQKKRYLGRRYRRPSVPPFDTQRIANWLNGRVVGQVGNKLFWFAPTSGAIISGRSKILKGKHSHKLWATEWINSYYATGPQFLYLSYDIIYKKDAEGRTVIDDNGKMVVVERIPKWVRASMPTLRQDGQLDAKDIQFWNSMPDYYHTKILQYSPGYPNPPKRDPYYY